MKFLILLLLLIFVPASDALSYIGPGAGFAFLGSAFVFVIAFIMAFITVLLWPLRFIWKLTKSLKIKKNAMTDRVIILGLDGLDPTLTNKYLSEGLLPNIETMSKEGVFCPLATTYPSISPVAWSTFQTGVNPGAHNIFDFLTRDKKTYLPILSSSEISEVKKFLTIGKHKIPLSKPTIKLLRKSKPFWKVLGEAGIFSNILRVPISFPPEKFYGNSLSAMCTPDLKGSQGTFTLYTSETENESSKTSGRVIKFENKNGSLNSFIEGPVNPFSKNNEQLTIPFKIKSNTPKKEAVLFINNKKIKLVLNKLSDWIELKFKTSFGIKVNGICRFCLRKISDSVELYLSPVNIHPSKPALPISHPKNYSVYLSNLNGLYATLGLAEDTWALNEKALDEESFLEQVYLTHKEREKMFFDSVSKTKKGLCACVFDASDRIQHTFFRYIDEKHPAPTPQKDIYKNTIRDMYIKMDKLIGKTVSKLKKNDVIIVMSDHGFKSFRRCVNLNTWLFNNGYLALKNNKITGADYFSDIDWSKTKAYALGLGGIYLNKQGREKQGILNKNDVLSTKKELISKLSGLIDPVDNSKAVRNVYDNDTIFKGLYKDNGPDLIIGFEDGYRVSWESVTGKLKPDIFEDNTKAWSGDHAVDTAIASGIFLCNRKILTQKPAIIDIAPSVLKLLGVTAPKYMEGNPLF